MLPERLPRHAVFLQGPNGPFFRRYSRDLQAAGSRITKFNFNPGDGLFFRGPKEGGAERVVSFRGTLAEWPDVFREYAVREEVDAVFLFGDCRPIHVAIREVTAELDIAVWVFEEGYIRPDHVTLERGGVNGNSSLPKDPEVYRRVASDLPELPPTTAVGNTFWWAATWATVNSITNTFLGWRYPNYQHHRNINAFRQCYSWVRGGVRKVVNAARQRHLLSSFEGEWTGRYFLVPLQVHCDSQLSHSEFASVPDFIRMVAQAFASAAPPDTRLVFKHHPHDRAYCDYTRLLGEISVELGLGERVIYIHDLHLPTLLKNARGTVVMNSTVGLSSLYHGTPVIALGEAVYNIPGLTFDSSLESFFNAPGVVDAELYDAFTTYVRRFTQLNGTFQKRLANASTHSGLASTANRFGELPRLEVESQPARAVGEPR